MMETFKVIFSHKNGEDYSSETVEVMAENEESLVNIFQNAEPFAIILKVERI